VEFRGEVTAALLFPAWADGIYWHVRVVVHSNDVVDRGDGNGRCACRIGDIRWSRLGGSAVYRVAIPASAFFARRSAQTILGGEDGAAILVPCASGASGGVTFGAGVRVATLFAEDRNDSDGADVVAVGRVRDIHLA